MLLFIFIGVKSETLIKLSFNYTRDFVYPYSPLSVCKLFFYKVI